jgi:hypothetical protein
MRRRHEVVLLLTGAVAIALATVCPEVTTPTELCQYGLRSFVRGVALLVFVVFASLMRRLAKKAQIKRAGIASGRPVVCVDIESDGCSILSIGACTPSGEEFYVELKPYCTESDPKALRATGLDREEFCLFGREPEVAMRAFAEWACEVSGGKHPIFIGLGATYDYVCLHNYFVWLGIDDPFASWTVRDTRSYCEGVLKRELGTMSADDLCQAFGYGDHLPHNALADAKIQLEMYERAYALSQC